MARSPGTDARRRLRRLRWRALGVALAALALGATADATPPALRFARHGESLPARDLGWLRAVAPESEVRVHEPYEASEVRFLALPFAQVLDAVFTPSWREEEELLFTCRDGYQPTLPVARFLAHRAWLAYARPDAPGFRIRKRESGREQLVELGPFYLVWENLDDPRILEEADYGWPYQLAGVELIRSRDRFPGMAPPVDAPPAVLAGFEAYRVHCFKCHALAGEGGRIGPDLLAGADPEALRDPEWLRTWIVDPSRIRPDARMPALNPALPDRARVVEEILAYLRALRERPSPRTEG